jgi:hypothetical protein
MSKKSSCQVPVSQELIFCCSREERRQELLNLTQTIKNPTPFYYLCFASSVILFITLLLSFLCQFLTALNSMWMVTDEPSGEYKGKTLSCSKQRVLISGLRESFSG